MFLKTDKKKHKKQVENNRKIASRRIFFRLLLQRFSFTISPFFLTIFQIVLLIHMPASGLGLDISVLGRVQPPVTLMPRLLFHCISPHTLYFFLSLHPFSPALSASVPPERPLRPCNCCLSDANERSYNKIAAGVKKI